MSALHQWRSRDGRLRHAWPVNGPRPLRRPVCGANPWDERYDQPALGRCPDCEAVLARREDQPIAS